MRSGTRTYIARRHLGPTAIAVAAILLAGCGRGGNADESTPPPSTPITLPTTAQDTVQAVVLPKADFPRAYTTYSHVERGMDQGTNNLCGPDDPTEKKRVARVQVYYYKKTRDTVSNEVVAYDEAAAAAKAIANRRALSKRCTPKQQHEANFKDLWKAVKCPAGFLPGAVCETYSYVGNSGKTEYRYGIVQQRGVVFDSVYGESVKKGYAATFMPALGRKAAERMRKEVRE